MPVRLQRRRTKDWRMPDGAIYVGRPSKWGNPFKVGDLYKIDDTPRFRLITADFAVDLFLRDLSLRPIFRADILRELRGHDLVCWCRLDQPCHADVLLEIANG